MCTKGKWRIIESNHNTYLIRADHDLQVCEYIKSQADAHLIAAAPDLYEAAKEIMERFNGGIRFPLQSSCDKMNEALAKARSK